MNNSKICNNLKEYLDKHGVSQKWLSDTTGIPYKSLNDMVNGVVNATAVNLSRIAKALNVEVTIFFRE